MQAAPHNFSIIYTMLREKIKFSFFELMILHLTNQQMIPHKSSQLMILHISSQLVILHIKSHLIILQKDCQLNPLHVNSQLSIMHIHNQLLIQSVYLILGTGKLFVILLNKSINTQTKTQFQGSGVATALGRLLKKSKTISPSQIILGS